MIELVTFTDRIITTKIISNSTPYELEEEVNKFISKLTLGIVSIRYIPYTRYEPHTNWNARYNAYMCEIIYYKRIKSD